MGIECYDSPRNRAKVIEKKINPPIEIKNSLEQKQEKYKNEKEKQDFLSKTKNESKDIIFNKLKDYEEESDKYKNEILINGKLNLSVTNNEENMISNIIDNERSKEIYKEKIINEIKRIKEDKNKYNIEHLTILLVGKKGVGKTTLINYMLKLDENYKGNIIDEEYFKIYTSNKVPYLKLIEFKGIGVDIGNDPEIIGEGAYNCINNMINSNSRSNYNDIIHCIWYCTTGTRFEDKEVSLIKKLKEAYNDVSLPIIIVYTKTVDPLTAKNFKLYILNVLKLEASFVKVLALKSDNQKYTFGDYKLLRKTLFKFKNALKGEMINLMTKSISSYIKDILFDDNKQEMEIIIKNIILKFNSEYKIILTDEEFKNYVVELLGKNLINFYKDYKEKISNKTLNLIKQSINR